MNEFENIIKSKIKKESDMHCEISLPRYTRSKP